RLTHGLAEAVPGTIESIAHILTGIVKPSLEELRASRTSALGRLNLFGHVATDQEIHNAIIRRATQQEVTPADLEKQAVYFVPVAGQGLLAYDVTSALMDAKTPGDFAETVGNFLGSLVFFTAIHKVMVGRTLKGIEARGKAQSEAAKAAAQARVLAGDGENAAAVKDIPIRDVPSVVESEQAAIKARLLDEEDGNIVATIMRVHRELNNDGTTIIPNVPRARSILENIDPNIRTILHNNGDGTHDVALTGDDSPLRNKELAEQFEKEGYYKGQEVSYNGKPVVYDGERLMKQVKVTDLDGNEFYADPARIRRPGYTKSATLITKLAEVRDVPLEEVAMGDPRENRDTGVIARLVGPAYRVGKRLFVGPRYDLAKKMAENAGVVPAEGETGELGALNTENKFIRQEDLPAYFKE